MLRPVQVGNALPISYPLDPSAVFEPGMIGELKLLGTDIVLGVSSGLAPLGLIDDVRTRAFTQPQTDEIVIFGPNLVGTPILIGGQPAVGHDMMIELQHPSIIPNSFATDYPLIVNYVNGTVRVPANSLLNFDSTGQDGPPDSIRAVVSYTYQVPDIPGEDTTVGSGRMTLWFLRGIWQTDQWDTTQGYPLNATLYCGLDGKLTTKQPTPAHPGIAIVLGPPSTLSNMLEFLWL